MSADDTGSPKQSCSPQDGTPSTAPAGSDRASALDKHFDFGARESQISALWEHHAIGQPASNDRPVFNIAMPPPNANGELHLGHSFGYTVMDILGRFHRLLGERVLLLPGKDHAGIQTQVVYEKKLKTEKVDTSGLSREELFERCYDFCIDRAQYMRAQEKTVGLSADWSRELFTLDPRLSDIVFETFERMWRDGLIYRGKRIINWSVFSQTAISDVEVEYKEQDGGLWFIAYPFVTPPPSLPTHELTLPSGEKIPVGARGMITATTRPETMLGDTALAVHPEDPRYRDLIGRTVRVPLVNREIPIIGDKRVDPTYGTGVVKVTPAHDFLDYDIGRDHELPMIQVIGKDGKMTPEAGAAFAGLTTTAAREAVIQRLTEEGRLVDTATMKHKVPIGERGKDIIEPLISEQWFVNVDKPGNSLKGRALELIRSGKIKVYPARFQVLFEQWLENLRDWNISRQIWWGHRLPVWYRRAGETEEVHVGRTSPGPGWEQDTDTFDTWFSSGQWAFSTMAAHGLVDLDAKPPTSPFFPTHTMVMGRDILFFWACRMLLLTTYRVGDVPWRNIFFTGLIRDEHGQKMSKSKGNGIEPNEMISKFGADALRLALVMGASPGNDINLGPKKIEGYSKFINKVWNAAKLVELKVGHLPPLGDTPASITLQANRWIMVELARVHGVVTAKLHEYEISIAADELYNFVWSTFCDWYLEIMKVWVEAGSPEEVREVQWTATTVLRAALTMLHPFIPFVTEEIHQRLGFLRTGTTPLATAAWPAPPVAPPIDGTLPVVTEIVSAIRSVKAALVIPHKEIRVAVSGEFNREANLLISQLARVTFVPAAEIAPELALRRPYSGGVIVCEVEGKENYRKRLEKDLATNRGIIESLDKKLSGAFATQAKPEIVEKERERLTQARQATAALEAELVLLGSAA
jgi:valyl-tRNA synthetase